MGQDISGFGFQVNVQASVTFPNGLIITQFADDADPFDTPAIKLADSKMGLNGNLVKWSVATPIEVTLNVVPGSTDDENLAILAEANRVGAGKASAQDVIQLVGAYPQGNDVQLIGGYISEAAVSSSVAAAGRLKSKPYKFVFENRAGAPA